MEKIAILGDVHYINSKSQLRQPLEINLRHYYKEIIDHLIKTTSTSRFISVGDIAHTGQKNEFYDFYAIIEESGVQLSHVMGNHDLFLYTKEELNGLTYYQSDQFIHSKYYDLLYLDTAKEKNEEDWGGILTKAQLKLFKRCVVESKDRLLIVITHHPVYDTTCGSTEYLMSIEEMDEINSILELKKGQGVFVNGHTHLSSMMYKWNWCFVQAASIMNMNYIPLLEIEQGHGEIHWFPFLNNKLKQTGMEIGSNLKGYTFLSDGYLYAEGNKDGEDGDKTDRM